MILQLRDTRLDQLKSTGIADPQSQPAAVLDPVDRLDERWKCHFPCHSHRQLHVAMIDRVADQACDGHDRSSEAPDRPRLRLEVHLQYWRGTVRGFRNGSLGSVTVGSSSWASTTCPAWSAARSVLIPLGLVGRRTGSYRRNGSPTAATSGVQIRGRGRSYRRPEQQGLGGSVPDSASLPMIHRPHNIRQCSTFKQSSE